MASTNKLKIGKLLLMLLLTLSVLGCLSNPITTNHSSSDAPLFCVYYKPVCLTRNKDSERTINQVVELNYLYISKCGSFTCHGRKE